MPEAEPTVQQTIFASEWNVLELLLGEGEQRPLSIEEIAREIGSPVTAADAVSSLDRAGLIHRTSDGFIFASRAAVRYHHAISG